MNAVVVQDGEPARGVGPRRRQADHPVPGDGVARLQARLIGRCGGERTSRRDWRPQPRAVNAGRELHVVAVVCTARHSWRIPLVVERLDPHGTRRPRGVQERRRHYSKSPSNLVLAGG
jgi:hypothetical protein